MSEGFFTVLIARLTITLVILIFLLSLVKKLQIIFLNQDMKL